MQVRTREIRAGALTFHCLEAGRGPLALLLHGFPDHNKSFKHLIPELASAGFHAVAPNLPGYAPTSTMPDGCYNLSRVAEAIGELIPALGATTAHIVGHDWGAGIAYVSAVLSPQKISSITAMAVPHLRAVPEGFRKNPGQFRRSWYMFFFQMPFLPERALSARGFRLIEWFWSHWSPGWAWRREDMDELKRTFDRPGVPRAALAYYRALRDVMSAEGRRTKELGFSRVPVRTLALTGDTDGCVSTRLFDYMQAAFFPAGLTVKRIDGAGHFLHLEKPDEVNGLIVDFITHKTGGRRG